MARDKDVSRKLVKTALAATLALGAIAAAAAPAEAETVRATLTYLDGDGTVNPIRNARVEIHRLRPRWGAWNEIWGWGHDHTVTTDANGFFTTTVPFHAAGTVTGLRVFATNAAAQVMTQDFLIPFYRQPGLPQGEIQWTSQTANDVLDFSFHFTDDWARNHFNIADAMLRAFDYASARRDPRETDALNRVDVHFNSATTYYDPVLHAVRLTPHYAMDDFTVVHEYTHYLQEAISSFYGIASYHDGCVAHTAGVDVRGPGLAWMEGFASYLPLAINRATGGALDGPSLGSLPDWFLETPSCAGSTLPASSLERFVGAALFDLSDPAGGEFFDEMSDRDTEVFQIFDRELDIGWTNPTIDQFITAWIGRGLDVPQFLQLMGGNAIVRPAPATVAHYDALPAANLAVYRPSNAGWYVLGGGGGMAWFGGLTGDVPVPADYDGDGLTDVAIRRRADATWWVKKSMSGSITSFAQGAADDVPLPADYDADGEIDFALYRVSTGQLLIHGDTAAERRTTTLFSVPNGVPIAGNFVGDNRADAGIYDPSNGWFYARTVIAGSSVWLFQQVGNGGDVPVVGDYNGDGRTDLAVYEPDTGRFLVRDAVSGVITPTAWGYPNELPVPADFDGNGSTDIATWDPVSGWWFIRRANGTLQMTQWGTAGDVAIPAP